MTDLIDSLLGLAPGDPLYTLRRNRPEFVDGAEICCTSTIAPAKDQGLDTGLRVALAHRMAKLNADTALATTFLPPPEHTGLAEGKTDLPEPLASIARHVDLVTLTPANATEGDIRRLESAGLTNPQIVALSELIAFVNFQTRISAGLRLLGAR